MVDISMRELLEAGVHFGPPDPSLESQDEKVHLWCQKPVFISLTFSRR